MPVVAIGFVREAVLAARERGPGPVAGIAGWFSETLFPADRFSFALSDPPAGVFSKRLIPCAALARRRARHAAKRFKKVENAQAVIWKMRLVAEQRFRRLKAPELMQDVYTGAQYANGVLVKEVSEEKAA